VSPFERRPSTLKMYTLGRVRLDLDDLEEIHSLIASTSDKHDPERAAISARDAVIPTVKDLAEAADYDLQVIHITAVAPLIQASFVNGRAHLTYDGAKKSADETAQEILRIIKQRPYREYNFLEKALPLTAIGIAVVGFILSITARPSPWYIYGFAVASIMFSIASNILIRRGTRAVVPLRRVQARAQARETRQKIIAGAVAAFIALLAAIIGALS
jgi:hypothetical protein